MVSRARPAGRLDARGRAARLLVPGLALAALAAAAPATAATRYT